MLVVLAVTSLAAASAGASPPRKSGSGCEAARRWAEACAAREGLGIEVVFCPSGGVVLSARMSARPPVRVEIARGRRDAFTTVGELGISPVAEYEDWGRAPQAVRETFDRVVACVRADPRLGLAGEFTPQGPGTAVVESARPVPWFGLFGAVAAVAALSVRRSARSARTAAALASLALSTAILRLLLVPPGFAHQNGQGPLWIDHALGAPSVYGPGYAEVLGAVARLASNPDRAVFLAQAVLASLVPVFAWVVARACGARPSLAWATAFAVSIEPVLARLGGSESYFATTGALLFAAGAVLARSTWRPRVRDRGFLLGAAAAGLLAAQAVRVHPIAAVPAAALPVVALVGAGTLRARLRVTGAAALVIGGLALAGFVGAFGDLTGGELGKKWTPGFWAGLPLHRVADYVLVALVVAVPCVVLAPQRRRAVVRGAALVAVALTAAATHLLGVVPAAIEQGYAALFAAPALAAVVSVVARARRPARMRAPRWIAPVAVVLAAVTSAALRGRALVERPTDARELDLVLAWRERVPETATIAFLGVSGDRRLFLPVHGAWKVGTPFARQLDGAVEPPDLAALGPDTHYYRSSLCSAAEAREWCAEVERTHRLTRVESATLPATPSMGGHEYAQPYVEVALFRVERAP